MNRLTVRTKRFWNITIQIVTGHEPALSKGQIRENNINWLFTYTPAPLERVKQVYADCLILLKDVEQAKKLAYEKLYE